MNEEQLRAAEPFLREIIAHPENPAPYRLKFADWLDSQGLYGPANFQRLLKDQRTGGPLAWDVERTILRQHWPDPLSHRPPVEP